MDLINSFQFKKINIPEQVRNILETSSNNFLSIITKFLSTSLTNIVQGITKLPVIGIYIAITMLSTYFICTDKFYILDQLEHHLPKKWVIKLNKKIKKIISTLGSYLKAEMILVGISFVIVLIGLYILKFMKFNIAYPLLFALAIGFVDALPILRFWNCNNSMGCYQ